MLHLILFINFLNLLYLYFFVLTEKRNCREWSQYETRILMDMYRRNVTQVGPTKKFKSKKEMFMYIAQSISTKLNIIRSAHQCENR